MKYETYYSSDKLLSSALYNVTIHQHNNKRHFFFEEKLDTSSQVTDSGAFFHQH